MTGWLSVVLVVYAAMTLAGGIYGYMAKGSVPSLVSSAVAAILIGVGLWLAKSNQTAGYAICALVAAALAVFFGMKVVNGSLMPGVPALVSSLIALGCVGVGYFMARK